MSSIEALKETVVELQRKLEEIETRLITPDSKRETGHTIAESPSATATKEPLAPIGAFIAPGLELDHINQVLQKLARGRSQEEILTVYLREACFFADRGILFLCTEGGYSPWQGEGFRLEDVPALSLGEKKSPIVDAARRKQIVTFVPDPSLLPWLADTDECPQTAGCIPLPFGDSVPLVLYLDSPRPLGLDSLELITQLTILVLKNHQLSSLLANERGSGRVKSRGTSSRSESGVAGRDAIDGTAEAPSETVEQVRLQEDSGIGRFSGRGIHRIKEAPPLGSDLPQTGSYAGTFGKTVPSPGRKRDQQEAKEPVGKDD